MRLPFSISNYDSDITTPVSVEMLDRYLQGYDEQKRLFLVDGFTNGFRIPFEGTIHSWDDETRTTLSFDEKYTHDSKG